MERVTIPVNEHIAVLWNKTEPEQRAKIISMFCWLLETDQWRSNQPENFTELMNRISDQAVANGLTPEILEEILNEA
jgi:flagellar biosynthesis regulator FlaF